MSYIGRPVKEDEIKRVEQPDIQIVSVPVRPSERAARRRADAERRREEWIRRIERELPEPVEPEYVPERKKESEPA